MSMNALVVAGVVPLCVVTGALALAGFAGRALRPSRFDLAVLAPAIGVAVLTPLLVLIGVRGFFSPWWLGLAGWVAGFAWLIPGARRRCRLGLRGAEFIAIGCTAIFAVVAWQGRDEPWTAGRDQQVYAELAVSLATRGSASVSLAGLDAADRALAEELTGSEELRRHLGVVRTATTPAVTFESYLPLGWPVWLAFGHALAGDAGLALAGTAFLALGALLLYAFARRFVGRPLAVGAAGAVLALPSTLWIAGISLAEPLSLVLWMAIALLVAVVGQRTPLLLVLAVFASAVVRIDALAVVPALLAAFVLDAVAREGRASAGTARLGLALAGVSLATLLWYHLLHSAYLAHKLPYVGPVVVAAILMSFALLVLHFVELRRVRLVLLSPRVRGALVAALILAFAYAAFLRPSLEPFALIGAGSSLAGTRDFREDSLWNLAAYLGWPLTLLALAGVALALWRWLQPGAALAPRVMLAVTLGFALLYLWFPLVSPDHPWGIRRFVPVVLPGLVFFAAYALRSAFGRRGMKATACGAVLIALGVGTAVTHGATAFALRENAGVGRSIADLGRALPDALVVADMSLAEVAGALLVAHGRPVVVADFRAAGTRLALDRWMSAKAALGRPAWLLHGPMPALAGARMQTSARQHFVRDFVTPSTRAPARDTTHREFDALLSSVVVDPDRWWKRFGAEPVWGIAEQGFHATEVTEFGLVRLTDGGAVLRVPAAQVAKATSLHFDFLAWSPDAKPIRTQLRVAGRPVWEGPIAPGITTIRVPMPEVADSGELPVEIDSETFDTRAVDPRDTRGRVGIGLMGLRFERGALPVDTTRGIAGYRSELSIAPGRLDAAVPRSGVGWVELAAANAGTRAWPALREHGIDGAVQVGLRWYRRGQDANPVADNRGPLALSLRPGEATRMRLRLDPAALDGARLPPGSYTVRIGLVREKHAWFADSGDALLALDVDLAP